RTAPGAGPPGVYLPRFVRYFARKGSRLRLRVRQTIGSKASLGLGSICPPLIPAIRTFFPIRTNNERQYRVRQVISGSAGLRLPGLVDRGLDWTVLAVFMCSHRRKRQ